MCDQTGGHSGATGTADAHLLFRPGCAGMDKSCSYESLKQSTLKQSTSFPVLIRILFLVTLIHGAFAGKLIEKSAGLSRHDRTLLLALRAQSGPVRFEIGLTPTV